LQSVQLGRRLHRAIAKAGDHPGLIAQFHHSNLLARSRIVDFLEDKIAIVFKALIRLTTQRVV
jgi:hypothetical protein